MEQNLNHAIKRLKHQTKLDLQHLLTGRTFFPSSVCTPCGRHCVLHVTDVDGCVSDAERTHPRRTAMVSRPVTIIQRTHQEDVTSMIRPVCAFVNSCWFCVFLLQAELHTMLAMSCSVHCCLNTLHWSLKRPEEQRENMIGNRSKIDSWRGEIFMLDYYALRIWTWRPQTVILMYLSVHIKSLTDRERWTIYL
jgi:hypothetical protein